jgi:CRP/FNR family transcriptional regulator, cyclic AMP receptor protein
LDILVGDNVVGTLDEGGIVGEMAPIDDAPRAASVIANTECRLVGIDRTRFHLLKTLDDRAEESKVNHERS